MSNDLNMGQIVPWTKYAPFRILCLLIITMLASASVFAQSPVWAKMMYADASISEVSDAYEEYYKVNPFEKNKFTQDYKRFLRNRSREAFNVSNLQQLRSQQKTYQEKLTTSRNNPASWEAIGPFDIDLNSVAVGATPGLAHVYTVEKDAFLIAGTATAGVWKSTTNGSSWSSISKDLMVTEVKAVEVKGNTVLFGGNGHIYKSTNGGSSWQTTGSSSFKNQYHRTLDIVSTSSSYFAASNYGLYKSSDQGSTWELKVSGSFLEIEIHPSQPEIIYAVAREGSGTAFYRSENGGESFNKISNGYPQVGSAQEQLRTEIAVTEAMPDRVVALATGEANGGSGLFGIYVSDDAGLSWQFRCCGSGPGGPASSTNKNIMAWQTNGQVNGGQYYYDVALAISQTNGDHIYAGGINIWKSTDGGASFVNNADYIFKKAGQKYVHADIQDIRIYGNEIWVASDGGIFMSSDEGETFSKRMAGIVATDFRGFGAGAKDGEVLIGGTFHNGTLIKDRNTYDGGWLSAYSGDNTHGQVNPQNNRITYSDIGMMILPGNASATHSVSSLTIKPNASYTVGESSEYAFHPTSGDIFFLGSGGSLYKTSDNGSNFSQLKNFGSGKVTKIEVAPSNPNFIYVVYYPSFSSHKRLFRTKDGGQSWEDISPATSVFQNSKLWMAWDIAVGSGDENELWLARTPQTSADALVNGQQIFKTSNGGSSWENVSGPSLNGEMITNIVHQKGTDGGVYVGTRRAVFYKNNSMSDWLLFKDGLPALTYSTSLVILYNQDKIINATQRGVYATELYEKVDKTVSIQVDKTEGLCSNDVFQFSNNSAGFLPNAQVKWTFENGLPSTSTEQNPVVKFNGVGSYNVTLEITENGSKSISTEQDLIRIQDDCDVESLPGSALRTTNSNFLIIPPLGRETNEITFTTWVKRSGTAKENAGLVAMRRFSNNTGMSLSASGELKYMWDKVGRGIPSGLTVPMNEWTHVAMSVSPSEIRVYVNGIERSFQGNFAPVAFDKDIYVGKDANSISYYLNGSFDELSIFDEALSTEEIRAHMNLVKESNLLPSLIHYFQFNDEAQVTKDIIGSRHANFFSNPDYVESMAPIGKGISEVKKIDDFGIHHFSQVGVDLNIESGISCNSDLGVYKIERNVSGSSDTYSSDYMYIVNHFSEDDFTINGEITIARAFEELGNAGITSDSFKLHQLDFDDIPEWDKNTRAYGMHYDQENEERIVFEVDEEQEMEGKFLVSYNQVNASLAISDIYFELKLIGLDAVDVQWFLHPEDHFIRTELQRSGDGRRFETIETIDNERGQLDFRYVDKDPLKGRNYYRVKMTYANGESDFSKIDQIRVSSAQAEHFLYPNPAVGDQVQLRDLRVEGATLSIYDLTGKKLLNRSNIESGTVDISSLATGVYLVVVEEKTARRQQLLVRD